MELDDTQAPATPKQTETLNETFVETSGVDADIEVKLDGLREVDRVRSLDGLQRRATVAAGLFGEELESVKIGRFAIIRKLGAGGMGIVYLAYDEALNRRIAVKLLRNAGASYEARIRLAREAQAMARLSSPHVVTVHEVGEHEGQIFIAMEFVEGHDLRSWLELEARNWRAVVEAFRQAGEGLAAAHAAGIIHRDFKPDNVLVGEDGRARVADFGLANSLANSPSLTPSPGASTSASASEDSHHQLDLTRTGALLGTPVYMPPEQHAAQRSDARSDQFSFCAALWEGLYGQRPFSGTSLRALAKASTSGVIDTPPSEREVPNWLREIVTRGLAPAPADRWPSMRALLDAIGDDPSLRRRRIALRLGLALGALALLAAGYSAVNELQHNHRQRYWNSVTELLLDQERDRGLAQARDDAIQARDATRMSVVRSYKAKIGVNDRVDPTLAAALLREVEGQALHKSEWLSTANEILGQAISTVVISEHRGAITSLVFSPDGQWLYSASDDGQVRRARRSSGVGEVIVEHGKLVEQLTSSPDGQQLASCGEDGSVRLWSAAAGAQVIVQHERPVKTVRFDPTGRYLASGDRDGHIHIHTLETGASQTLELSAGVNALGFDETGEQLIIGGRDGMARLWHIGEPEPSTLLEGHQEGIYFVRLLADAQALTASDDGTVRLWSLASSPPTSEVIARHLEPISAFDLRGQILATAATDGSLRVTSLVSPHTSLELPRHDDAVWNLHLSADARSLASASFDGTARITAVDGRSAPRVFRGHRLPVYVATVDPSGRWLATGSYDSDVRIWDLERPLLTTPLLGHDNTVFSVELDATGGRAVTASHDGTARVWNTHDASEIQLLDGRAELRPADYQLNHAVFNPQGTHVATAKANGEIDLWSLEAGTYQVLDGHTEQVWKVAFDATGERLVSASFDETARIWNTSTGALLHELRGHENLVIAVHFDPPTNRVVTGSWDSSVRVWDAATGAEMKRLDDHSGKIISLAHSPLTGQWASGSDDGTTRLWPPDFEGPPLVLAGHEREVWSIAFDHTGSQVATSCHDGRTRIWDTQSGTLLDTLGDPSQVVWDTVFLRDGRIASGYGDGALRIWSPQRDTLPITLRAHEKQILSLALLPDGLGLVSTSVDHSAQRWDLRASTSDTAELLERLRASTNICLSVERRLVELGESPEQAQLAAESCSLP